MNGNFYDASFDDNKKELTGISVEPVNKPKKKKTEERKPTKKTQKPSVKVSGNVPRNVTRADKTTEKTPVKPASSSRQIIKKEKSVPAPREVLTFREKAERFWVRGLVPMLSMKNEKKVKTVSKKNKGAFPVSAVLIALLCTILFMFLIISYVQINEYTLEVSTLRNKLSDLMNEDKDLSVQLEKKNDMVAIEERASSLGMVKVDQLTKKHITLTQDDNIEVVETEPSDDSTVITTVMSGLWSNFSGIWEYMK